MVRSHSQAERVTAAKGKMESLAAQSEAVLFHYEMKLLTFALAATLAVATSGLCRALSATRRGRFSRMGRITWA